MTDNDTRPRSKRRSFLQSMAAAGLGAAVGTGTVAGQTDSGSSLDSYHRTLRNHLTEDEDLPAGEFVYGTTEEAALDAFTLQAGSKSTETRFDVSGNVPITQADRIEINEAPSNAYSYTYKANITGGTATPNGSGTDATIEEGDVLLAVVYLRSPREASPSNPPQTNAGFKFRYTTPDGATGYSQNYVSGTTQVNPETQWQRYFFPIEITSKPEGSNFQPYTEFWTGYSKQTIEFGGLALVDYSASDVTIEDLPTTSFDYDYPGRAEDAAWREQAHERIEEIRKTDFEVNVVDADGNPVEGAAVDVEMQEHDFGFGGEFTLSQIGDRWESDVAETYRQTWLENFNKAALTNSLKAYTWSGEAGEAINPENARRAIQWLLDHDVPNRGHALVWEEYDWMNIDPSLSGDRINELVKQRIRTRASEFQGDLPEWDMHNHPIWQSNIRDDLGRDVVPEWWATGHDAAPDAQMYVNEMNIIAGNSYRDPYDEFISWLMEQDAGVGGIGFMGHFTLGEILPPTELLSVFDRFAEHGVPLQLTEFEVTINDRSNENEVEAQADFVRDVLTAAFSHEALEGVMSWCFWDQNGGSKRYYSADWTLRPHGEEYQRLVFDEWWTDDSGETSSDGRYSARGFKGTYEVTARADGSLGRATVTFDDENGSATVELAPASVGDIDLSVDEQVLRGDETTQIGVTLTGENGTELPAPASALSFESDTPDAVTVSEEGVVSVAGTGSATVTVTAPLYDDTAVATAEFAAYGEPAVRDTAADLSKVESNQNLVPVNSGGGHGDDTRFAKNSASEPGWVTYRVPESVAAFRAVAYVNTSDINSDVFEDLRFAVSSDGESFQTLDVERTEAVAPGDSNGYYALWRYNKTSGIPDGATYLRVTIPTNTETWATSVGEVAIWSNNASVSGSDATGPSIVIDDLQSGRTYEAPHEAGVSVTDAESAISERSVTLDGQSWSGGTLTARGQRRLAASATNAAGITTDLDFGFTVENEEHDLIARQKPSATDATVGERLTFRVQDTTGNDRWIDSLEWSFGDGTSATGWWAAHRFEDTGAYRVSLTATDNEGRTTTDTVIVRVADLSGKLARAQPSTTEAAVDERIAFEVKDTTGEGRWIDSLAWDFGDGVSATGWWAEHRYDEAGTYTVALTATDNTGHSTTHEVEITVS